MATIAHDCPHCGATKAGFTTIGVKNYPIETAKSSINMALRANDYALLFSVAAMCPVCHKPIALVMLSQSQTVPGNMAQQIINRCSTETNSVDIIGLELVEAWPKPPKPAIPEHLPEPVHRAFAQAERNFFVMGNEEASALMYRRSLELSIKERFPDLKGSVAARTKKLVEQKDIPSPMGDWADEIRDLGNDAAHEQSAIDKAELTKIRGFADALLKYLYTLPAEIEARRKLS